MRFVAGIYVATYIQSMRNNRPHTYEQDNRQPQKKDFQHHQIQTEYVREWRLFQGCSNLDR